MNQSINQVSNQRAAGANKVNCDKGRSRPKFNLGRKC